MSDMPIKADTVVVTSKGRIGTVKRKAKTAAAMSEAKAAVGKCWFCGINRIDRACDCWNCEAPALKPKRWRRGKGVGMLKTKRCRSRCPVCRKWCISKKNHTSREGRGGYPHACKCGALWNELRP